MKIYHALIQNRSSLPKRIGAYVITHVIDNMYAERYAGSSKNLYTRFYGHCNKDIIYIDVYITDNLDLAESLERILMELIKPATNIKMPSLSEEDKEIMKNLSEDNEIKKFLPNNVVKIGCRYIKCLYRDDKRRPTEAISFTIETEIANTIKKEAKDSYMNVSQYMRKMMTEKYKNRVENELTLVD